MAELGQGSHPVSNDPKTSIVKSGSTSGPILALTASEQTRNKQEPSQQQSYSQTGSKLPSLLDINTSMASNQQNQYHQQHQQLQTNGVYPQNPNAYMSYNAAAMQHMWNPWMQYSWMQQCMGAAPPPPPPPHPPN
jgi:hypothetical protein